MKDVNIQEIAKEINKRKKELGESVSTVKNQRFLDKLIESLKTGRENESVHKIKKTVDDSIMIHNEKTGTNLRPIFNADGVRNEYPNQPNAQDDRDELMYNKFDNALNERLQNTKLPMGADGIRSSEKRLSSSGTINEGALINLMDRYMNENYGAVIEKSIRNVMFEAYSTDRIKNVLTENKDFIKTIVVEIIRELQKTKKQQ